MMLLLRGSSHDVEQKIHTRAREKDHEALLWSVNIKKDSPHSFTDASVPRKKGSAGPVQERRDSGTLYETVVGYVVRASGRQAKK